VGSILSLINERLAKSMLSWTHSGFSLDMSAKIPARCSRTREALAQCIARPPVSLSKMLVEEHEGSVLYRSEYNPYFKTDCRLFPALEFLVQLLQHLPDPRTHLVRRYGLYSSLGRQPVAKQTAGGAFPRDMVGQAMAPAPDPRGMAAAAPAAASPFCASSTPGQRRAVCLHPSITFRKDLKTLDD
jgi:hypothetical protein